jgi:DNA polymerase III subunit alpha
MFLIFDTETTGLPMRSNAPLEDLSNWPRVVQLAWQFHGLKGEILGVKNYIIKPEGFIIPYSAEKVHGISTAMAEAQGRPLKDVMSEFYADVELCKILIGHNIDFDLNIVAAEFLRSGIENTFLSKPRLCTKELSTNFCALPGGKGGKFKWPNLNELYTRLFNEGFQGAHNASADVAATARCFFELIRLGLLGSDKLLINNEEYAELTASIPLAPESKGIFTNTKPDNHEPVIVLTDEVVSDPSEESEANNELPFVHLHLHTQYSILDGASSIKDVVAKAKEDGMKAIAITDHGNLYGVKSFHAECTRNGIKPIIGCEVYMARRTRFNKDDKVDANGDHLILLAKDIEGYHNLIRLVSYGFIEGFYYKPRIDMDLLKKYSKGLIVSSACLGGVVPQMIMDQGVMEAEKMVVEFKEIFGDDFYLELMRHPSDDETMNEKVYKDQVYVNKALLDIGKKYAVKCIASNDVHFVNPDDAAAHDHLICLSTGKDLDDPNRMRYTRQEWFKTRTEMHQLFADIPEVLANTVEIAEKVKEYKLNRDAIMPDFPIPDGFLDGNEYLRHLSYKGAELRYGEITEKISTSLDYELDVIKRMGFPGYFLIVQDFINAAREMGVSVGPGRGSAAGSVVAYCTGITDIDPIKYNLLFERFLNPDRVSMPDIDIDFDEDGREDIVRWVVEKYGKDRVAQIITFGTMAAKMAIRDVARIQRLPLSEADRLSKLVPERPGTTLKMAYSEVPELRQERNSSNELIASTLKYAEILEGSVRHTGIHACGIIIGKDKLIEHIPVFTSKDSDLLVTQFDGKQVEDVGMLKMDFLGLKTLSIIKDTLKTINETEGIDLKISEIDLEDKATFDLFSNGDTTGIFQFESPGMRKHLRELKPNRFEDLIAMNALYRPGPMEYIPNYINRKHGREKIVYDLPEMEDELKETYGITVYQEQVMRLSQTLAGFTRGEADSLRKAMGKKIRKMMDEMKEKFLAGCLAKGFDPNLIEKIWMDWEAFAQYAFNKSHSTCYALVAYQTAWLKAHYPAAFMSAVLSRNSADIKKIGFFMDECRRMGIEVLGPDVNESSVRFTVNKAGNIRFGLGAIKGVGEGAVISIIRERKNKGPYKSIYDFIERIDLHGANRKTIEGLAATGAFDCFPGINRGQYFASSEGEASFIDNLIKYGSKIQGEKGAPQKTLFGDAQANTIVKPAPAAADDWALLNKINMEKELLGIYLTAHPLDRFKAEIKNFCNSDLHSINNSLDRLKGREISFPVMVKAFRQGTTQKNDRPYGIADLEDYNDTYQLRLWGNDFVNFKNYFNPGMSLLIKASVEEWVSSKDNRRGLDLKIKSINMLSEVKTEIVKTVKIVVPAEAVSDDFINTLMQFIVKPEKGVPAKHLKIQIVDSETKTKIDMFSRNNYIELSDKLFAYLENAEELTYSLN